MRARRDLTADEEALYRFYAARIPEGIYSGPSFETWRKQAERENPRLLFLDRAALLAEAGPAADGERFPDHLDLDGLKLPLSYRFTPGAEDDGVTLTVPLAAVNQVDPKRLDWLVPGLRAERMAALLKSLPKALRRNFVPTPNYVQALLEAMKPNGQSLTEAMSEISSTQRLAVFGGGAEFIDIYDKFVDEDGNYTQTGPDLNGAVVKMRKGDGLLFTTAGADKLAFYVTQTLKLYYHGGGAVGLTVADALAGTDAVLMVRPPYQGLGQTRLLEIAGAVIPLTQTPKRASDLVIAAAPPVDPSFTVDQMLTAPKGRVDDFGLGQTVVTTEETPPVAAATPVAAQ